MSNVIKFNTSWFGWLMLWYSYHPHMTENKVCWFFYLERHMHRGSDSEVKPNRISKISTSTPWCIPFETTSNQGQPSQSIHSWPIFPQREGEIPFQGGSDPFSSANLNERTNELASLIRRRYNHTHARCRTQKEEWGPSTHTSATLNVIVGEWFFSCTCMQHAAMHAHGQWCYVGTRLSRASTTNQDRDWLRRKSVFVDEKHKCAPQNII